MQQLSFKCPRQTTGSFRNRSESAWNGAFAFSLTLNKQQRNEMATEDAFSLSVPWLKIKVTL